MKVNLGTVEIPDNYRRAIRARVGESGLATRREVRLHVEMLIETDSQDLCSEFKNERGS